MESDAIENLREMLNKMFISENTNKEELLKLSQNLDRLIVKYMRGE